MYAALNEEGNLVYAVEVENIENYHCPKCLKTVRLIQKNDSSYFQHLTKKFNEVNERNIHKKGKDILVNNFSQLGYQDIQQEKFLTEIKQKPDILLTNNLALEYQCATISSSKFKDRIDGYSTLNIKSIWILGGAYLNKKVLKKHLKFLSYDPNWGFYLIMLDSENKIYHLFYQIRYFGLFNKIKYSRKDFYTDDISELFKFSTELKSYPPIKVDHYQIQRIKNVRGVKVDKLKSEFFNQSGKTVEEYLLKKSLNCQKPVYSNHYWRILCGEEPRYLEQPLLFKKIRI